MPANRFWIIKTQSSVDHGDDGLTLYSTRAAADLAARRNPNVELNSSPVVSAWLIVSPGADLPHAVANRYGHIVDDLETLLAEYLEKTPLRERIRKIGSRITSTLDDIRVALTPPPRISGKPGKSPDSRIQHSTTSNYAKQSLERMQKFAEKPVKGKKGKDQPKGSVRAISGGIPDSNRRKH